MRKPYEKPAIIWSEKLTARAVACAAADEACRQTGGPINS
jgi:hypothetical protein